MHALQSVATPAWNTDQRRGAAATRRPFGVRATSSAAVGVGIYSVSPFYDAAPPRAGLLLGYAALDERDIRLGIERLARLIATGTAAAPRRARRLPRRAL